MGLAVAYRWARRSLTNGRSTAQIVHQPRRCHCIVRCVRYKRTLGELSNDQLYSLLHQREQRLARQARSEKLLQVYGSKVVQMIQLMGRRIRFVHFESFPQH